MDSNRYESFAVEGETQKKMNLHALQVHLFSKKALLSIVF